MINPNTEVKQVIVIRKDLNMRKGKMCAQASHASIATLFGREKAYVVENENGNFSLTFFLDQEQFYWYKELSAKIVVYVNNEEELLEIHNKCIQAKLPVALIQDAGLTEFGGVPTYTCLGIGPANKDKIDLITGNLPLM